MVTQAGLYARYRCPRCCRVDRSVQRIQVAILREDIRSINGSLPKEVICPGCASADMTLCPGYVPTGFPHRPFTYNGEEWFPLYFKKGEHLVPDLDPVGGLLRVINVNPASVPDLQKIVIPAAPTRPCPP